MHESLYTQNKKHFTQIGSVPYGTDLIDDENSQNNIREVVKDAVVYSLRHDIPFLPELSRIKRWDDKKGKYIFKDSMRGYIQNPGRLYCSEELKKYEFDTFKLQCFGPISASDTIPDEGTIINNILSHITSIIDGINAKEFIVLLDEPSLQSGTNYSKKWGPIFDAIKSSYDTPIITGVHTCGEVWGDEFMRSYEDGVEIISFDARINNPKRSFSRDQKNEYEKLRKNMKFIWGVTEPSQINDWRRGDLASGTCGMGGLNDETGVPYTEIDAETRLEMLELI